VPAPWGYLGTPGTTFETNQLLAALGGRSTGTMAHPIPFGALMAVAVTLCFSSATGWPLLVRLLAAAALSYGVALSGSRSAALVLALALLAAVMTPGVLRVGAAWRIAAALVLSGAVLTVRATELPVVTGLEGTGSLTHRLAALDVVGRLADRSGDQVLLGSGAGSLDDLFAAGLLQLDGFFAVDNQLVATFAVAGLVGVLALVGAVVAGLVRGDRSTRPATLLLVLMFFSFDVLEWHSTAVLLVVLLVLGSGRRDAVLPSGTAVGGREATS
jgi:O-antigen ligase